MKLLDYTFYLSIACFTLITTVSVAQIAAGYSYEGPILLKNISVIDGLGHQPYLNRDVLIDGGVIQKIAVTSMIGDLPENTKIIEGTDLTVMPGLVDLHVHLRRVDFTEANVGTMRFAGINKTLNALLYAGVTRVFDMGNDHDLIIQLRDQVAAGKRMGPTIHAAGQTIPRLQSVNNVFEIPTKGMEEIKQLLDKREAANIKMIKLYTGFSPWSARHLVHEAHKRDILSVADFWCSNLSRDLMEVTGIDGYAHGGCRVMDKGDAEWMRKNGKFVVLTLIVFETMGGHRIYPDIAKRGFEKDPLIVDAMGIQTIKDYYDNAYRIREYFEDGEQSFYQTQLFDDLTHLLSTNMENARILQEAGVLMGTGTDGSFPPGTWFGEGLHHELELLVEAGLKPLEVIKMATSNGAKILRVDSEVGAVSTGKIADLLIVEGNPAEHISDTRNIRYVIQTGKIVNRASLKAK